MSRSILHVDMDAFYASVEVLDDPGLRGKPVIVGGTPESRGVVSAASYEARAFGVHSAMSAVRARRLCPRGVFLPVRMERYEEVSRQVFSVLRSYTDLVEGLSIDEAFLDVTGSERLFGPAESIGRDIRRRVREELGLTCSVGLAPNKFVAKVASDIEKPDGFVVVPPGKEADFLAPLPVERLWGVGKVTAKRLRSLGIATIGALTRYPAETLGSVLGSSAAQMLELARGIDARPVDPTDERKSLGAETTFPRDVGDEDALHLELQRLVDRVGRELRAAGLAGRTMTLKARFPDFSLTTRSRTLAASTCSSRRIMEVAGELLSSRLDRAGRPLRLLGVSVSGLERAGEGAEQSELFVDTAQERTGKLERAVDMVREEFGDGAMRRGSQIGRRRQGKRGS